MTQLETSVASPYSNKVSFSASPDVHTGYGGHSASPQDAQYGEIKKKKFSLLFIMTYMNE